MYKFKNQSLDLFLHLIGRPRYEILLKRFTRKVIPETLFAVQSQNPTEKSKINAIKNPLNEFPALQFANH